MRTQLSGVLWIHSMPGPLQPHITWALARLCMPDGRKPGQEIWRAVRHGAASAANQHGDNGQHNVGNGQDTVLCAEVPFVAEHEVVVTLVDTLARWPRLYFELAHDPAVDSYGLAIDGMRYCHVPQLGTFAGQTDAAGNIVINEDALRAIVARGGDIATALDSAIGGPWDRILEPMRLATAGFQPIEIAPRTTPATTPNPGEASAVRPTPMPAPMSSAGADRASAAISVGDEAANVLPLYPRRAAM